MYLKYYVSKVQCDFFLIKSILGLIKISMHKKNNSTPYVTFQELFKYIFKIFFECSCHE
jgi:hypothetical protein